jgi:methanethiol S-methyltransferase
MIRRMLVVGYGLAAYVIALASVVYTVGFVANVGVPRGIDDGQVAPLGVAIVINTALLGLFAVQHTVMARPAFKRWLTRFVPAAVERSTFVLAASLVLVLLLWQWQPMPETIWSVEAGWGRTSLYGLYLLGWATVVASTFMIDHFDLFGFRQVMARARDRTHVPPSFRVRWLYRFVRHPMMVGFVIAFWAAPEMSQGRVLFAVLGTGYILVGVRLEERDLRQYLGEDYARYETEVPQLVPRLRGRPSHRPAPAVVDR